MRGVGRVFEAYRDGELEDDDEVAVAHAGREDGYRVTSEAMVNIRQTLMLASEDDVIGDDTRAALTTLAKATFYASRGYPGLLVQGRRAGLPAAQLKALSRWLPTHRVDQKRADAVQMLQVMHGEPATGAWHEPSFTFQHTQFFERARRSAGDLVLGVTVAGATADPSVVTMEELLDELRLDPAEFAAVRQRALARCLAVREARRGGSRPSEAELQSSADAFRRERGLLGTEVTQRWLAANDVRVEQFAALMREEEALRRVTADYQAELDVYLRSQVRVDGLYPGVVARIAAKHRVLAEHGIDDPSASVDYVSEDPYRWFFASRGIVVPGDIAVYWRSLGFADDVAFRRAVLREYWFSTLSQGGAQAGPTDPVPQGGP